MNTLPCSTSQFQKKADAIARHYGFLPLDEILQHTPPPTVLSAKAQAILTAVEAMERPEDLAYADIAEMLTSCVEHGLVPLREPILLYQTNLGHIGATNGMAKPFRFSIHIIGTAQSIAEALVLKVAHTILEEVGLKNTEVRLSSIGDRDSSTKFIREATAFFRRYFNDLPLEAQHELKKDVFAAIAQLKEQNHPLFYELPRPVEFLTTASRKHFREVLEFIETASIPYHIDEFLIGHRDVYTQSVFEITQRIPTEDDLPLRHREPGMKPYARGGRFDEFSKRFTKNAIPTVSMIIELKTAPTTTTVTSPIVVSRKSSYRPQVCFVHVGFEAKLKSIAVIEMLRKAHIPFHQCLQHDRLTDQLADAERMAAPFTMIMGQREALEGRVIVRNSSTRAQQIIAIDVLPAYFKTLKTA